MPGPAIPRQEELTLASAGVIQQFGGAIDLNISFLTHFDGFTTSAKDESFNQHPMTFVDTATQSIVQKKFGRSSLRLDRNFPNDHVSIPDHPSFDFGTGDFSVSLWAYPQEFVTPFGQLIILKGTTAGPFPWGIQGIGIGLWLFGLFAGGFKSVLSPSPFVTNVWQHLCMVREAGTMYAFVDGVLQGSVAAPAALLVNALPVTIGGQTIPTPDNSLNGFIDEVLIIKGINIFPIAGFTPPAGPTEIGSSSRGYNMQFTAASDNVGDVYIGDKTVSAVSNLAALSPGDTFSLSDRKYANAGYRSSNFYAIADNANDKVTLTRTR